jgi:hypothetical protein
MTAMNLTTRIIACHVGSATQACSVLSVVMPVSYPVEQQNKHKAICLKQFMLSAVSTTYAKIHFFVLIGVSELQAGIPTKRNP